MASPASPTRLPRANFCTSRHSHLSPAAAGAPAPAPAARTVLTSSLAALSTPNATLCFHARNVPSISIESYLVRIAKYCPTTNEVFVSLLVYFDRMSHLPALAAPAGQEGRALGEERVEFAVDSFNIHRLIIAGITVASKFFSDVFYTNSRYAKVGTLLSCTCLWFADLDCLPSPSYLLCPLPLRPASLRSHSAGRRSPPAGAERARDPVPPPERVRPHRFAV